MAEEMRILMLEDAAADAVLVNHALREAGLGFRLKRVDTRAEFLNELQNNPPDLILSDHGLPEFDGFTALAIAQDKSPQTPFIFVTESLGEEIAIETLKCGAADYVLKSRLGTQLVPAIRRAMREAEARRKHRQTEHALQASEERFRLLVEGVKDYALCMLDPEGLVMNWNSGAEWIMGHTADEIVGRHFSCFYTPEDVGRGKPAEALRETLAEGRFEEEGWRQRKGGSRIIANVIINALRDKAGRLRGYAHVTRDITELKQAQEALQKSWSRYRQLVELFPDAVLIQANGGIIYVNDAAAKLLGADSPEQLVGKAMKDMVHPPHWEMLHEQLQRLREEGTSFFLKRTRKLREEKAPALFTEVHFLRLDGTPVKTIVAAAPLTFQYQPAVILFAYDIRQSRRKSP